MREQQQGLLREQDASLDSLHGSIQRVKALGGVMRDELAEQAVILESLEEDVDKADTNMQTMQKKLKGLVEQTKNSDRALYAVVACLTGLLLVLTAMVLS
jgi:uncharacterized coiled-coil protein SlyX